MIIVPHHNSRKWSYYLPPIQVDENKAWVKEANALECQL